MECQVDLVNPFLFLSFNVGLAVETNDRRDCKILKDWDDGVSGLFVSLACALFARMAKEEDHPETLRNVCVPPARKRLKEMELMELYIVR